MFKSNGRVKVGLIGFGYWGPNYARILTNTDNAYLGFICDLDDEVLKRAKKNYPRIKVFADYKTILKDKELDAVIIATPTKSHYQIVLDCLKHNKHVLVEKPLTTDIKRAGKLIQLAMKRNLVLMVGQTYLYHPAVEFLKNKISRGVFGRPLYFISERRNLGPIREDVNVLWDLAPHDISTILHLSGSKPLSVHASGMGFLREHHEDIVNLVIKFKNNIFATVLVSWLAPSKIRKLTLVGDKKMFVFDDVDAEAPIKIMNKSFWKLEKGHSFDFSRYREVSLYHGDTIIPSIPKKEPLREQFLNFIKSIEGFEKPRVSHEHASDIIQILEACNKSLKSGKLISISYDK